MAAFFQNLFKKRSNEATRPDSSATHTSTEENSPSLSRGPEQSAIDTQRETLADSNTTQQTLVELAINGLAADIRLESAKRLTDETLLQNVQKAARGKDKGVYQHTRQVLQDIRRQQDEQQATQDALAQLAKSAEDLAATSDNNLYEARTQKLEARWQSLEASASNEQKAHILGALHTCRQRIRKQEEERQEALRHTAQKEQRHETLTLLQETLDALASEAPAGGTLPSLDALQRTQENRWLEATRGTEVSRQEQKQYETLMQTLRATVNALRRLGNYQSEIDSLTSQEAPPVDQVQALLAQLEWPSQIARPESVRELAAKARTRPSQPETDTKKQDEENTAAKLESCLDELEAALSADQFKESRQYLKQAQGLQRQLSGKSANRFHGRLQRLTGQVRELGDWRGFATEPKQIALCEQMEHLAEQPTDPEAKAARIQELQQEWRDLGGSSNRDLWQRFRSASEAAFEPCKTYFEARSDLKKVNLQKRHNICEELARYLEASDWNQTDWKAAEEIEKTARREWREAWPVEFRDNRPVQKEFDRLMNVLSGHLDGERRRNESLKQEIVDRARELREHSPLTEAMSEAKNLQKQWQSVGVTRHREDRKLWKAFRAACDEIFARRDEQRQQQQQETSESDRAADAVLERARSFLSEQDFDEGSASELIGELEAAAAMPVSVTKGKDLRDTAHQLKTHLRQRQQLADIRQWQAWVDLRQQGALSQEELPEHWSRLLSSLSVSGPRELVVLSEILNGCASPDEDQTLRMELQVKRLKEGFEGGGQSATNTLETMVAHWCLALPQDALTPELASRFRRVLEAERSTE